jgi:tetratricopeptide (TPR) repeat protein
MTSDHKQSPASEPLRFESPLLGAGDQQQFSHTQQRNNKALWGIFALLIVLTAGVVFVLPSLVQPAAPPVVVVAPPATTPNLAGAADSAPFAEAQRLRMRQQAQEVLQPLLALQDELETQQVRQWAGDAFTQALTTAQQGDSAYSSQGYEQALSLYQQALTALQTISANRQPEFAQQLALGNAALLTGNGQQAAAAFAIAVLLDPTSDAAAQGLARAKVLDQVLALLAEAKALQDNNDFDAARSKYQAVLQLDASNQAANTALTSIRTAQANATFAAQMSRGYAALQAGNTPAAKAAFEQAGTMRPGAAEVTAALQQANDQQTLSAITVHINAAQAAEANEAWSTALAEWTTALGIDPNLVTAKEGQQRTQSRTNLDQFLNDTLANPFRLGDQAAYAQTEKVLRDATSLLTPGPKLQQQVQQVQDLLTRIKIPVNVSLQSDGLTAVTVYGVGELGLLTTQTLNLVPGSYVAVGVRKGYRDVRQEFVVGLDGKALQLTVICNESI